MNVKEKCMMWAGHGGQRVVSIIWPMVETAFTVIFATYTSDLGYVDYDRPARILYPEIPKNILHVVLLLE